VASPAPRAPAAPQPPARPTLNRALLIAGAVAIAVLLVLLVVVAVGASGGRSTIAIPPTDTPLPTFTPTATIQALPTPTIGQLAAKALCTPEQLAATVVDPQTGQVLLAHNADHPQPIASTTKVMTALVVLFYGSDLNQTITITPAMYAEMQPLISQSGSVMGISQPNEKYTLRDLLYGLLVPSGDDAAIAIADGLYGSQAAFVARMNDLARWLHLTHTTFINPHGLDLTTPHNLSTAADLARLTQVAMYLPDFRQIVATPVYTVPANATHGPLKLYNTNTLLSVGKSLGIDGVKTGFTGCPNGAGHCIIVHAALKGHELIVVVLGDGEDNERFIDAAALLTWGFQEEGVAAKLPAISLTPTPHP
jgi:serine-type D-Ala-D-Ala carboxypeptidase (penicillin-binding protein 5/6)